MSNLDYYTPIEPPPLDVAEGEGGIAAQVDRLEKEMKAAAKRLEFEEAAVLRDRLRELRELQIFSG